MVNGDAATRRRVSIQVKKHLVVHGSETGPLEGIDDIIHNIMHPLTGSIYMLKMLTFTQIYVLKLIWGRDCVYP